MKEDIRKYILYPNKRRLKQLYKEVDKIVKLRDTKPEKYNKLQHQMILVSIDELKSFLADIDYIYKKHKYKN